jgi:chaperonin GroES
VTSLTVREASEARDDLERTAKPPALRPRGARVLVRPVEIEQNRESGIFIPQSVAKKSNEGIVVAIGPGTKDTGPVEDLRVGDRVLFLRWTGYEVQVDGQALVSVHESSIVAVADEGAVVALGEAGVVD